ncbi:hypothetical protein K1719_006151 [Acacia pycnantha]|nr:hypothetical protein K1719_006151 [Acacia pycnantha]
MSFKASGLKISGKQGFVLLTALVILPTTWLRNLGVLAYVSVGGVLTSIILLACIVWVGFDAMGFHERGKIVNWRGLTTSDLMLESIKDIIESEASSAANNTIPLKVSSRILIKVIQYCYKHVRSFDSEHKNLGVDLKQWDAKFVKVDNTTLFDLILASNYLNIKSL